MLKTMRMHSFLEQLKITRLAKRSQAVLLSSEGYVLESCETLFPFLESKKPLSNYISFIKENENVIKEAETEGLPLFFEKVRIEFSGIIKICQCEFQWIDYTDERVLLCIFDDHTEFYEYWDEKERKNVQDNQAEYFDLIQTQAGLRLKLDEIKLQHQKEYQTLARDWFMKIAGRSEQLVWNTSLTLNQCKLLQLAEWNLWQKLVFSSEVNLSKERYVVLLSFYIEEIKALFKEFSISLHLPNIDFQEEGVVFTVAPERIVAHLLSVNSYLYKRNLYSTVSVHLEISERDLKFVWKNSDPYVVFEDAFVDVQNELANKDVYFSLLSKDVLFMSVSLEKTSKNAIVLNIEDNFPILLRQYLRLAGFVVLSSSSIDISKKINTKHRSFNVILDTFNERSDRLEILGFQLIPLEGETQEVQTEMRTSMPVFWTNFPDAIRELMKDSNKYSEEILDLTQIYDIVDGQAALVVHMLQILDKNLGEYPQGLLRHFNAGEFLKLRELAHKFKSCTAYTGLDGFNLMLKNLELSEQEGKSPEYISNLVHEVMKASEGIRNQVRTKIKDLQQVKG